MSTNLYNIDSSECLGDALAKINSNFLALEMNVCNFQTDIKSLLDNQTYYQNTSSYIENNFNFILKNYNIFNNAYTVTTELTKYWTDQQLTVYIPPHNISVHSVNIAEIIRVSYLNVNYSPSLYPEYLIANVVKTNFNKLQWKNGALTFSSIDKVIQVKELSHTIYRYFNINGVWQFIESIYCPAAENIPDISNTTNTQLVLSAFNYSYGESTMSVDIAASISSSAGYASVPSTDYLSWSWYIDSTTTNIPVTAVSVSNVAVNPGDLTSANDNNIVRFTIAPNTFSTADSLSSLNVICYDYSNDSVLVAATAVEVTNIPDTNLFDVGFTIYQNNVIIGDSSISTLTRTTANNTFTFTPSIYTVPHTEQYRLLWIVHTPTRSYSTDTQPLLVQMRETGLTTVTLCAYNVTSGGWGAPHSRSKTINLYQLNNYKAPEFIIYPSRAWSTNLQKFVDINNSNYLTVCQSPSAYGYKENNTEIFTVSATQGYNTYVWSVGNYILSSASNITTLTIPYSAGLYELDGAVVSLTAFNDYFPAKEGINYNTSSGVAVYPITASTDNTKVNAFMHNPRIVEYDNIIFNYDLNTFDYDLAKDNKIISTQTFTVFNNLLPTKLLGGTVNYTLFTDMWTAVNTTPASNGIYELFCLNEGDSSSYLAVDVSRTTNLTLSACAVVNAKITDNANNKRKTVPVSVCFSPSRPEYR